MPIRNSLLSATMLSGIVGGVFLTTMSAHAADVAARSASPLQPALMGPAVDGFNAKIEGFGGTFGDHGFGGAKGSWSMPLGGQYGLQLDGAVGTLDSRAFGSGGAHLFWRDPAVGLFGLYANHTYWDQLGGVGVSQVAGEFEWYLGRWSVQGIAGVEFGNNGSSTTGTRRDGFVTEFTDIDTRFFDKVDLAYYLQDNWKAFVGHRYIGGKNALALGTEIAMPLGAGRMASIFAEGRVGEDDYKGIWGGVKFYFGQRDKTLIQRHRQDDPINWSPESLFTIINKTNRVITPGVKRPAPPPPPPCESCDETCCDSNTLR